MTGDAELLIIDNASTDDTPVVAARLASSHARVTVYREAELGISAARNAALKKACGEFVLFLDDDETAEPDWLATYQRFLSAPPSEKIAVAGGAVFNEFEAPPPKWVNAGATFDGTRDFRLQVQRRAIGFVAQRLQNRLDLFPQGFWEVADRQKTLQGRSRFESGKHVLERIRMFKDDPCRKQPFTFVKNVLS